MSGQVIRLPKVQLQNIAPLGFAAVGGFFGKKPPKADPATQNKARQDVP